MSELIIAEKAELSTTQGLTADLYTRFVSFIDAKPKTVDTYTKALKQLFAYLSTNGINNPTREDIIAFREGLKETGHKPTTIQNYITATRLFFQWLEEERIYPNVAAHIKGAKLDREHKKDYLTSRQVKTILSDIDRTTLQGKRDYAMLVLMITGGLRTIEVSRADIGDLRTAGDNTVLMYRARAGMKKRST